MHGDFSQNTYALCLVYTFAQMALQPVRTSEKLRIQLGSNPSAAV